MKKKLVLRKEIKDMLFEESMVVLGIIAGLIFCYILCQMF